MVVHRLCLGKVTGPCLHHSQPGGIQPYTAVQLQCTCASRAVTSGAGLSVILYRLGFALYSYG